jgi:hypothetical protein
MGTIYRPKYKDKLGQKHEIAIWWLQYYTHGKCIRESAQTTDHAEAKKLLKQREGDATKGRMSISMTQKVPFSELAALVEADYQLNGYCSFQDLEMRHRLHVLPYFGKMRANQIGERDIDRYLFAAQG